ncbi:uncharacterized protein CC84DRAFT_71798 [Paraphaeosphaeria sporulosa]|uniref:Uncharacterized protein n=1 Tax=Paraphaeosphaeria sporulosa TaxID=1460663 RepID=A0A177CYR3_9PLEO|nr:uncharacterized protein CC84DRAFT_71798 [Paraphaeosphaeria sporulosa]OAG12178.1 hypothetical protein CC84DRAFT_71798 [Paraphaeosphaeria sporulosa]
MDCPHVFGGLVEGRTPGVAGALSGHGKRESRCLSASVRDAPQPRFMCYLRFRDRSELPDELALSCWGHAGSKVATRRKAHVLTWLWLIAVASSRELRLCMHG